MQRTAVGKGRSQDVRQLGWKRLLERRAVIGNACEGDGDISDMTNENGAFVGLQLQLAPDGRRTELDVAFDLRFVERQEAAFDRSAPPQQALAKIGEADEYGPVDERRARARHRAHDRIG